uniref:Uncharacterized protein n=1 Tax=Oryza sativa subsp. japonica TaxID=39947 RepID=Q6ZKG7_ORYSJ|nr:hypothetical protein [Oryza sativa Japonica Group]
MVGCEHMILKVVLMTIKDRFASYCCETLTVPTTTSVGNDFTFCIAWFITGCQTEKRREVRGGRWGVHASGYRGGDYDPGGIVTASIRVLSSIAIHGKHDVEAVSCGYSGTPLARVKLFE